MKTAWIGIALATSVAGVACSKSKTKDNEKEPVTAPAPVATAPAPAPTPAPAPAPPPAEETVATEAEGKVVNAQQTKDGTIITIDRGTAHGVTASWTGVLVDAKTGAHLEQFELVKVSEKECVGKVSLAMDVVTANPKVLLAEP